MKRLYTTRMDDKEGFTITDFYYEYYMSNENVKSENLDTKKGYEDDVRFVKIFLGEVLTGIHLDSFFKDYCQTFDNQFRKPWDIFFEHISVIYKTKAKDSVTNKDAGRLRKDLRKTNFKAKEFIGTETYNQLLQELTSAVIYNDIDDFIFTKRLMDSDISLETQAFAAKAIANKEIEDYVNTIVNTDSIDNEKKLSILRDFNLDFASFFHQLYSKSYKFETKERIQEMAFKQEFEDICVGKVERIEDIKTFPYKLEASNSSSSDVFDTSKK